MLVRRSYHPCDTIAPSGWNVDYIGTNILLSDEKSKRNSLYKCELSLSENSGLNIWYSAVWHINFASNQYKFNMNKMNFIHKFFRFLFGQVQVVTDTVQNISALPRHTAGSMRPPRFGLFALDTWFSSLDVRPGFRLDGDGSAACQ